MCEGKSYQFKVSVGYFVSNLIHELKKESKNQKLSPTPEDTI